MATMTRVSAEQRLVKYLTDAHSIEEQALTQMRTAPRLAGDAALAQAFAKHLPETERHERLVRARLKALGADPSRTKDIAGKAGGFGMLLFARFQPDTPGKLTAHAFSYEHMEVATYEMLRRAAEDAGDEQTAAVAAEIGEEERRMADRLASSFEAAAEASLAGLNAGEVEEKLDKYLADAHSIEKQAIQLLSTGPKMVEDDELARLFEEHLAETREHERRITERLGARGSRPSKLKDLTMRAGALNTGMFFRAQPDTDAKLVGYAFAFEHLEIGGYELLKCVALKAGDSQTAAVVDQILGEERAAAEKLAAVWQRVIDKEMAETSAQA